MGNAEIATVLDTTRCALETGVQNMQPTLNTLGWRICVCTRNVLSHLWMWNWSVLHWISAAVGVRGGRWCLGL